MKIAIMQPTYLPWYGYFKMIKNANIFVFLDDVQFEKRCWQQRNRILFHGKEMYLTVPVLSKSRQGQLISEVQIDESREWRKDHCRTLHHAYKKHPEGEITCEIFNNLITECETSSLRDFNIHIIKRIAQELSIKTEFLLSSDLNVKGTKSLRLLNICHKLNASIYLSAVGSRAYIEKEGFFEKAAIGTEYQHIPPAEYPQKGSDTFVSHLSIIDVLANIGIAGTQKYIS